MRLPQDVLWPVRTVQNGLHGTSLSCYIVKLFIAAANINAAPARECSTERTDVQDTNDSCTKAVSYGDYRSTMIWDIDPLSGENKTILTCHSGALQRKSLTSH